MAVPIDAKVNAPETEPETLSGKFARIVDNIDRHEIFTLAGSLAYTIGLALAPFLVIMLSTITMLGTTSQDSLIAQITGLLGNEAGSAVEAIAKNAENQGKFNGVAGIISFIIILISASAIFSQLRFALDKVDERKPTPADSGIWAFVRDRLLSMGLVLGFVFMLVVSLMVTTVISIFFGGQEGALWEALSFSVSFLLFATLFAAMFRFIPTDKTDFKSCAIAGLTSAVFFMVGKTLIGLYLGKSAVGSAYGAAGSLIVLLVWLYYSSITLLISYEFTRTFILKKSPAKNARPATA